MAAPAIAAILRRREREVVDDFRAAGATSPATAQSYNAIGLGDSLAIKRLRSKAVIRETDQGVFYLDEEVWTAVRSARRWVAVVIIGMMAALLIGVMLGIIKP